MGIGQHTTILTQILEKEGDSRFDSIIQDRLLDSIIHYRLSIILFINYPLSIIHYRFNYPRQVVRSDFTAKWIWENLGHNASRKWVGMTFKVKDVEILKRRSKPGIPCNLDWKHDDEKIMEEMIQTLQCRPPHWNVEMHRNICSAVSLLLNIFLEILKTLSLLVVRVCNNSI